MYWEKRGGLWHHFTLTGTRLVDGEEPVCHVSLHEAQAFAAWSGARLHPAPAAVPPRAGSPGPVQMIGDAWEWTADAFRPYPGYRPGPLAAGQPLPPPPGWTALRGGSALTPADAVRRTTRLALPPDARWQMTGIRLATDPGPNR